ncbi:ankyrin repeat-containing protein At5g02620-like [Ziziphus jujuba]|uniref:Ankyrin repeat-containing protein At5g02620-like n=1 Tax=Ziziphus jujuba TaxID=326968 RepID=A0ABM3IPQ7_ZIZJJ|nr:ankyrin repeat-containing protein At5g02620-like [Ziziphus jujuba]
MLDECKSPATGGPDGRNVLHAATIRKDEEMIKEILGKMGGKGAQMLEEADEMGWTPLHHAAKMGYLPAVKLLLELPIGREKAAYKKDKQGNTALHLAAALNCKEIISEIINWCPECYELVNEEGRNILHSAVQNNDVYQLAVYTILKTNAFSNLLNEKDAKGNTPLNHIAISLNSDRLDDLIDHPRVDKMAFNKQNRNAFDLASTSKVFAPRKKYFKRRLQKHGLRLGLRIPRLNNEVEENGRENSALNELEKAQNTNLIVAALIATVTFTTGFTVPGAFALTTLAMAAMVAAFVTGTCVIGFTTLPPHVGHGL